MNDSHLTAETKHRMETQRDEFIAADELATALKRLPAIVDDDYPEMRHYYESAMQKFLRACAFNRRPLASYIPVTVPERLRHIATQTAMQLGAMQEDAGVIPGELTFAEIRAVNVARCERWHPEGIESWSPSDWLTAVAGELGELASVIKMMNRERDSLPGNKKVPTLGDAAKEAADVFIYLDLLTASMGIDLAQAIVEKFNEVSERVGFPERLSQCG